MATPRLQARMPVILEASAWPAWLGEADGDPVALLRPAAPDVLRLWPVGGAVNILRSSSAELLDAVDDPHAPPPSDAPAGENPALPSEMLATNTPGMATLIDTAHDTT